MSGLVRMELLPKKLDCGLRLLADPLLPVGPETVYLCCGASGSGIERFVDI